MNQLWVAIVTDVTQGSTVSNDYKAALISLFWAPKGLNKLPEEHFKFPFNLIGKSTMLFSTGQSWHVLKSWYTVGDLEQGFQCCFTDKLNQSLVTSAAQASSKLSWSITELDAPASFTCYYRLKVSHYCVFLLCGNFCYLPCMPNHVVIKKFCH